MQQKKEEELSYRAWYSGDEELRAVGVSSSIGHRQLTWLGVFELEVLIGKLLAVDGLSTSSVVSGD